MFSYLPFEDLPLHYQFLQQFRTHTPHIDGEITPHLKLQSQLDIAAPSLSAHESERPIFFYGTAAQSDPMPPRFEVPK
jgi:hypothetical protein